MSGILGVARELAVVAKTRYRLKIFMTARYHAVARRSGGMFARDGAGGVARQKRASAQTALALYARHLCAIWRAAGGISHSGISRISAGGGRLASVHMLAHRAAKRENMGARSSARASYLAENDNKTQNRVSANKQRK